MPTWYRVAHPRGGGTEWRFRGRPTGGTAGE